jgi:hypothetical protein
LPESAQAHSHDLGSRPSVYDVQFARAELLARATISASADYLRANGIDAELVHAHAGVLGVCELRFFPQDKFDFADRGDGASGAVLEAFGRDGEEVLDLVAWPLEAPARATSMFRRVGLLGLWWAFNKATYIFDEPLQVYKTPLDWLRAGCAGCAVVAPPLAARDLLDVPGRVAGQDVGHALQLADLLRSHVDLGSGPIKGFASLAVS